MCKKFQKSILGIVTFLIAVVLFSGTTYAYAAVDIELPVEVILEGELPETEEEYKIQLKAEGEYPMPEDSENGVYILTVRGGGKAAFPKISFSTVGVYEYRISQIPGRNENCSYDETTYHIFVYVTNKEDGSLGLTVVTYENDMSKKSDDIVFVNKYETMEIPEEPEISPTVDTGDDSDLMRWLLIASGSMMAAFFIITMKRDFKTEK